MPNNAILSKDSRRGNGNSSSSPRSAFWIFALGKIARAGAAFAVFHALRSHRLPPMLFLFIATTGATLAALAMQKPWNGKFIPGVKWQKVFVGGLILAVTLTLWSLGLRECGPLRTLIMDGAEMPIFYLFSVMTGRERADKKRTRGTVLIIFAYLLLMFDATNKAPSGRKMLEKTKLGRDAEKSLDRFKNDTMQNIDKFRKAHLQPKAAAATAEFQSKLRKPKLVDAKIDTESMEHADEVPKLMERDGIENDASTDKTSTDNSEGARISTLNDKENEADGAADGAALERNEEAALEVQPAQDVNDAEVIGVDENDDPALMEVEKQVADPYEEEGNMNDDGGGKNDDDDDDYDDYDDYAYNIYHNADAHTADGNVDTDAAMKAINPQLYIYEKPRKPHQVIGVLLVIASSVITQASRGYTRKIATEIGGAKRFFSLSLTAAFCSFIVPGVLSTVMARRTIHLSAMSTVVFLSVGFFWLVFPYYMRFLVSSQLNQKILLQAGVYIPFALACFVSWYFGYGRLSGGITYVLLIAFVLSTMGIKLVVSDQRYSLPTDSRTASTGARDAQ